MKIRHYGALSAVVAFLVFAGGVAAQESNPRFGVWQNQNNPDNVMVYRPLDGGKAMEITVRDVESGSTWGYETRFDGQFMPMAGSTGRDEAAVTVEDQYLNTIVYRTDGEVSSVLENVISPDGERLWVTFYNADGVQTGVAIYRKLTPLSP